MNELVQQTMESFTQLPAGVERPIDLAAAIVAGGALAAIAELRYRHTGEEWSAPFSNPALLKDSIRRRNSTWEPEEKEKVDGPKQARRARLSPIRYGLAGATIAGAALAGGFYSEATIANPDANVVVVEDNSYSMLHTADLGTPGVSRAEAANKAIETADFSGNLGFVQVGNDTKVVFTPTTKWRSQTQKMEKVQVNPNGGDLTGGIKLAASLLPASSTKSSSRHEGTVVVVSDGSVDSAASEISDVSKQLKSQGVTVKYIVPGTPNGHYTLKGSTMPVASQVEDQRFADVPQTAVTTAPTAAALTTAIHAEIHDAGTTTEKHPWRAVEALGFLLLAGSAAVDIYQRTGRVA